MKRIESLPRRTQDKVVTTLELALNGATDEGSGSVGDGTRSGVARLESQSAPLEDSLRQV